MEVLNILEKKSVSLSPEARSMVRRLPSLSGANSMSRATPVRAVDAGDAGESGEGGGQYDRVMD